MSIKTVMVIGAGQMGGGIAQVFAQIGVKTYLNDIKQEFIDNRMAFIEKLLTKDVAKGRKTEEQKAAIGLGLRNVMDRMQLLYGQEAILEISSNPEWGTVIRLILPDDTEEGTL